MALFALGVLSGYGSHAVTKWLDSHVDRVFKVTEVKVPTLDGRTKDKVQSILEASGLRLGKVTEEKLEGKGTPDTVLRQSPIAGTSIARDGSVDITIGVE